MGGVDDHIHGLLQLKPSVSVADAMRIWKSLSSGWVHDNHRDLAAFAWQTGYAAFSVSESNADAVMRYIDNQEEHHRKMTFEEELIALLQKHSIEYDPQYVFD